MDEETPSSGEGMTLEQALARIAELEQQLAEAQAKLAAAEAAAEEMSARLAESEDEEKLEAKREAAQTALASIPSRTRRVVQPGESPERVDARAEMVMDEAEAHLAMQLRAGGMSEEKIRQKIAARRVRKVV
jgi:broad-specificity NMP kinase